MFQTDQLSFRIVIHTFLCIFAIFWFKKQTNNQQQRNPQQHSKNIATEIFLLLGGRRREGNSGSSIEKKTNHIFHSFMYWCSRSPGTHIGKFSCIAKCIILKSFISLLIFRLQISQLTWSFWVWVVQKTNSVFVKWRSILSQNFSSLS